MKRAQYCALLLLCLLEHPSIAFVSLLPIRGLRSTRLGVTRRGFRDLEGGKAQVPLNCTASHKIARSFLGMYCSSCGETSNFKTTCLPAAAEHEAAGALELLKINAAAKESHALELLKINAAAKESHALELLKINAAAKESQAQREAVAKNIRSQNLTVLVFCVFTLFVSYFASREVASWITKTVVPQLNGARQKLYSAVGAVLGFLIGRVRDWHFLF
jgi:hypothetical protein